jgi:ribosome biogenesis GTPase
MEKFLVNVFSGTVVRIKGAHYYVVCDGEEVRCTLRGRLRIEKRLEKVVPVVGDRVSVERGSINLREGTGTIEKVHTRHSIFARSDSSGRRSYKLLGANLNFVLLIFAWRKPVLNLGLLDRMLVASERGRMDPVICINKMDLAEDKDLVRKNMEVYLGMGYEVVLCSVREMTNLEKLKSIMHQKVSIMAGPSGSGKTSLVNTIHRGLDVKIGKVSEKTGKGRHTTSHFELHPLPGGGYLGDSPGLREFGIWGVSKVTLSRYFRDFSKYTGHCHFSGCTHSHEPDCGVKDSVKEGKIDSGRYQRYLRILETLPDRCE